MATERREADDRMNFHLMESRPGEAFIIDAAQTIVGSLKRGEMV
jgi:hypothetical protein